MITLPELTFSKMEKVSDANPPLASGIYMYAGEGKEIVYIGKTKCLRDRFVQHRTRRDVRGAVYYCFSEIEDMTDVDLYETYYINKYLPAENKAKRFSEENIDSEEFEVRLIAERLGISRRMVRKRYFSGK